MKYITSSDDIPLSIYARQVNMDIDSGNDFVPKSTDYNSTDT